MVVRRQLPSGITHPRNVKANVLNNLPPAFCLGRRPPLHVQREVFPKWAQLKSNRFFCHSSEQIVSNWAAKDRKFPLQNNIFAHSHLARKRRQLAKVCWTVKIDDHEIKRPQSCQQTVSLWTRYHSLYTAHTLVCDSNSVTRREIPPMWTAGVNTGTTPTENMFYTVVVINEFRWTWSISASCYIYETGHKRLWLKDCLKRAACYIMSLTYSLIIVVSHINICTCRNHRLS